MPQACADLSLPSRFALAPYLAAIAPFTALALCKAIRSGDPYCDGTKVTFTTQQLGLILAIREWIVGLQLTYRVDEI